MVKVVRDKTSLPIPLPNSNLISSQNTRNNNEDNQGSKDPKLSKTMAQSCTRIPQLRKEFSAFCDPEKELNENGTGSPQMSLGEH